MKIKKRNGKLEELSFNKIVYRIKKLANDKILGPLKTIDTDLIAQKVVSTIYDGVSSTELDEEAARIAISMTENLEFGKLASRLVISNLHKNTTECFSEVMEKLYTNIDSNGNPAPILADDIIEIIRTNKDILNETIDYTRDYIFDYFGFKTLEKSYLMKLNGKVIERPQHLYMRVSVQLHKDSVEDMIKTYNLLSQHYATMASPVMFNSGSRLQNLSSCYLIGTTDSVGGIFKTISDVAHISKVGGGIGIHINNIRSKGAVIRGTNGTSDGIIPMLKVYNEVSRYVNQCILPHIPVYSKDGIKRMDEITTSDYLITHDGSFKKVNQVMVSKKEEEILEIKIACGMDELKCTKIHDIYTIKSNTSNGTQRLLNQLKSGFRKPEFIKAEELTINDYVGFPIPTFEQDIDNWSLDKCRLYGIMLGDGNISFSKNGDRYQITLNNDSKLETKAFVIELLVKNNIHYWITNDCEICWTYNDKSIEKIGITHKMLYDKNHDKYCIPEVLHLPKNKLAMVMKGMMESDGCITDAGIFFSSTDKNLIQSLRYMCLRIGILTTCQIIDRIGQVMNKNKKGKDIISRKISYNLRMPKIQILKDYKIIDGFKNSSKISSYFEYNKFLYCRIKSINKSNYKGDVYDFNMIDNHNYLTDMGLVHNSGRRKGSFAMYLSPEHPDIMEFLDLRKNQGSEDMRARDLFLAMWLSSEFMNQVEKDGDWYLMCPDECPGLHEAYGNDFKELYWGYVEKGKYKKKMKAQEIWMRILESNIETGTPYLLNKDEINLKNNQCNLGTIKSSNLCTEIAIYSDEKQYGVCNLCSIALPKFIELDEHKKPFFNHQKLFEISKQLILPMNNIIDYNFYPVPEAEKGNRLHRPIGVGVQGLSCVFIKMRYPYESDDAKKLNKEIFETIYYGCLSGSMELAKKDGPYSTFEGSPFSKGKLQFDLWAENNGIDLNDYISGRWDWESLKNDIKTHGTINSLLNCVMPTASSAQIMGNTEACLASGTRINCENGLSYNIEDMIDNKNNVFGWNKSEKSINISKQINHLNQGIKETLKMTLSDGKEIICTPDHRFLTENGWKEATDINIDDNIISSIDNTFDKNYNDETDYELLTKTILFKMNTQEERYKTLAFSRLLGYILADGCIRMINENNYVADIYADTLLDAEIIANDINLLEGKYPKIRKNTRAYSMHLHTKLKSAIGSIKGITYGRRSVNGLTIPDFLLDDNCPKSIIREFLAGHFGGDGCIPTIQYENKTLNKGNLSGLKITHNIIKEKIPCLVDTMNKLRIMLNKFNIDSYLSNPFVTKEDKNKYTIKLCIPPTSKYLEFIGIRYCLEKQLKLTVSSSYWRFRELSTTQRIDIIKNTFNIHKNEDLPKTIALQKAIVEYSKNNVIISEYSLPSYSTLKYYNNKNIENISIQRQNVLNVCDIFDKMKCRHWFDDHKHLFNKEHHNNIPHYVLKVIDKSYHKNTQVWDLTIENNNSFLANGLMVHNCEPFDSCIFKRRVLSGEYIVVNKYLLEDLTKLKLWNKDLKDTIIANNGSVQGIDIIPHDIQELYKTVWEISMKNMIDQSSDRAVFIDQTQSMNLFMSTPTVKKLTNMYFYAYKKGLKTIQYYLRSKSQASASKFTIDPNLEKKIKDKNKPLTKKEEEAVLMCSRDNPENCELCSS